jgi:hypothetical protein
MRYIKQAVNLSFHTNKMDLIYRGQFAELRSVGSYAA